MGRGQVTVFFMIGLAVTLMLGISFYWLNLKTQSDIQNNSLVELSIKSQQLKSTVEQCMHDAGEKGLFLIAFQGGRIDYPETDPEYISYQKLSISYWNRKYNDISPTIENIEKKLSTFVLSKTIACLPDYEKEEITIDYEKADLYATIDDEDIKIEMSLPMTIGHEGSTSQIDSFSSRLDYNFGKDLAIAKYIMSDFSESNNKFYDLTMKCNELQTNHRTKVFVVNHIAEAMNHVQILSIYDYEPYFDNNKGVLRINVALRNITIIGYCNDF